MPYTTTATTTTTKQKKKHDISKAGSTRWNEIYCLLRLTQILCCRPIMLSFEYLGPLTQILLVVQFTLLLFMFLRNIYFVTFRLQSLNRVGNLKPVTQSVCSTHVLMYITADMMMTTGSLFTFILSSNTSMKLDFH